MKDDGSWMVEPRPNNKPPAAAEKKDEEEEREKARKAADDEAKKAQKAGFNEALNNAQLEAAAKAEAERLAAAKLMASAAEREKIEAAEREKAKRDEEMIGALGDAFKSIGDEVARVQREPVWGGGDAIVTVMWVGGVRSLIDSSVLSGQKGKTLILIQHHQASPAMS